MGMGKTETSVYKYNLKKFFFLIYKTQTPYLFKQLLSLLSADSCNDHFTLKFCTFAFLDMHVSGSSGYLSFSLVTVFSGTIHAGAFVNFPPFQSCRNIPLCK